MRALISADLGQKRICPTALYEYLLYGVVQDPLTLVAQIEALPAGHTLVWKRGVGTPQRYWQLQFGADELDSNEAASLTRAALNESVKRHFVSDVPVGIFLSGGLDSTAIVAVAKACGYERLKTLCISFDDPAYNEGPIAAKTAEHFGTEHYDWRMSVEEGRLLMAEFLQQIDRPSNDGFNTYCVSRFAHEHGLKVVLSGLGGDELFGGYTSFQMIPKMRKWHRRLGIYKPLRSLAGRIGEQMAIWQKYRRMSTFLRTPGHLGDAHWAVRGFFTPTEADKIVALFMGETFHRDSLEIPEVEGPTQPTLADEISYLEMTRYMRNQLLSDSDVMSMAWGLELRVPLVDRKLIDTVGQISARHRLQPGKRLLIDAVPEIPVFVAQRAKRGFQFPFEQWVLDEWRDIFADIERIIPQQLTTWYRHWCLFMLIHFLRMNGLEYGAVRRTRHHTSKAFARR
jgi:asparagine synthase (glutamine-hydrolysing)